MRKENALQLPYKLAHCRWMPEFQVCSISIQLNIGRRRWAPSLPVVPCHSYRWLLARAGNSVNEMNKSNESAGGNHPAKFVRCKSNNSCNNPGAKFSMKSVDCVNLIPNGFSRFVSSNLSKFWSCTTIKWLNWIHTLYSSSSTAFNRLADCTTLLSASPWTIPSISMTGSTAFVSSLFSWSAASFGASGSGSPESFAPWIESDGTLSGCSPWIIRMHLIYIPLYIWQRCKWHIYWLI